MVSNLLNERPLKERLLSYTALEAVLPGLNAKNVLLSQEARRARELQEAGAFDEALREFNRLITAYPAASVLYSDRGVCFYLHGMTPEAMKDLRQAIKLDGCLWPALLSFSAAASAGDSTELRGYCSHARACSSRPDDDNLRNLFWYACGKQPRS